MKIVLWYDLGVIEVNQEKKGLKNLQSQPTHFYDMLIKRRPVSDPILAHHQATMVPEIEYVQKFKLLSGGFPILHQGTLKYMPRMQGNNSIKNTKAPKSC